MVLLQETPIEVSKHLAAIEDHGAGAVVIFLGTVREQTQGKPVKHLEYEAYAPMALREMEKIKAEVYEKYKNTRQVAIIHRIGTLTLGEAAVCILVGTPHRAEGYEASRYAIEALKARVPIWKKEVFMDGEVWVNARP